MTTNNNETGARRFIIACLMMFGLLIASTPSQASSITISSLGTIPFNESVAGQYNLAGDLTWDGTTVKLTNVNIEALTANVSGEINYSYIGTIAAPAVVAVKLDGNWTSGSTSNTPVTISGGSIGLTAWATGGWTWNGISTMDYYGVSVASSSGGSFGPSTNGGAMDLLCGAPGPSFWWFGYLCTSYSSTFSAVGGRLSFSLAAAGDGIWLPGSAEVTVSEVPLPGAVWLLTSGLAGLAGLFGFTRRSTRPA